MAEERPAKRPPKKTQSLSRSQRMMKREEFVRLFDKPKSYKSPAFLAYYKENEAKRARIGITIKGRLKSVHRMRIKRIVREWFRGIKDRFGNQDVNIVVKVPTEIDHVFFTRLAEQLQKWKV